MLGWYKQMLSCKGGRYVYKIVSSLCSVCLLTYLIKLLLKITKCSFLKKTKCSGAGITEIHILNQLPCFAFKCKLWISTFGDFSVFASTLKKSFFQGWKKFSYTNNPPTNVRLWIMSIFQMICGRTSNICRHCGDIRSSKHGSQNDCFQHSTKWLLCIICTLRML